MGNVPLIVSAVVVPIASLLLYIPYTFHTDLFHPATGAKTAAPLSANLNLDSCRKVPSELGWCSQPVVQRTTGIAYFACDDTSPWWDPVRGQWSQPPHGKQGGSLWAWALKDESPKKLELQGMTNADEPFHPIALAVVPSSRADFPDANILLVSNHPIAGSAGVVDVYRHALPDGERSGDMAEHAVFYDRIEGEALQHHSPYRLEAIPEQWGPAIAAPRDAAREDAGQPGPAIKVPSFFFTAVPQPPLSVPSSGEEPDNLWRQGLDAITSAVDFFAQPIVGAVTSLVGSHDPVVSRRPTITEYLRDVLVPAPYSQPPKDIWFYLSTAHTSRPLFSSSNAARHHPPQLRAWDGSGASGGSNTSMHALYVTSTSPKASLIEQWDQHWVRGLAFGSEILTNKRVWKEVRIRWPDFLTFWNKDFKHVLRALDIDSLGRIWSVSAADEGRAEQLIEALRSSGAAQGDETPAPTADAATIQPGALVHQTTWIHRVGPAIGHPWEVERLANARKRGLWLPKEFYTTLVYRLGLTSKPEASTPSAGGDGQAYLPRAPTGIAVDEDRNRIVVTSSWDDGVAVCTWKEGWVEM